MYHFTAFDYKMEELKIYKTKREVMAEFNLGFTDYQAFKRLLDKNDVCEVFYWDRVWYIILDKLGVWYIRQLEKRYWKLKRNN